MSMNVVPAPSPLRRGHWRSLELLEDTEAVRDTLALYERSLGSPVYLRPTAGGLTVMSLESTTPAMVGVGPSGGGCTIGHLRPSAAQVETAVQQYRAKVAAMTGVKPEERYVLSRIRAALGARLELGDRLLFLHQEWLFTRSGRIDVLAIDEATGQLVVIEAKRTPSKALDPVTADQARGYVTQLVNGWAEYQPYFQRLAGALTRVYRQGLPEPALNPDSAPRWEIWSPGGHRRRGSTLPGAPAPAGPLGISLRGPADNSWRRELEQRQSRWRERQGYAMGLHNREPLRTRLLMPDAENELWNFLTPTIRDVVRAEYRANLSRRGPQRKLYDGARLFGNLLSSQPLAFNLFGELARDLPAATLVCRALWPSRVEAVTRIEFEWSPGRQNPRYLENGTAADIAVFHTTAQGAPGLIFIETKYYEDMRAEGYTPKPRYREVAASSGAFLAEALPRVEHGWLQQLWLDHLLLLAVRQTDGLESGLLVVAYPVANTSCRAAVEAYAQVIDPAAPASFEARTLEEIIDVMERTIDAGWVRAFRERYLVPVEGRER